jgi:hypothetical protein
MAEGPARDRARGRKVPNADSSHGGNARVELGSESRIREIRPSGLMRGRSRELTITVCLISPLGAGLLYCARGDAKILSTHGSDVARAHAWLSINFSIVEEADSPAAFFSRP